MKPKKIISIASGKGGVGKSFVSVHLAYALRELGLKVGLLDADIWGPSISHMMGSPIPTKNEKEQIVPALVDGISIISMAMFSKPENAQIMRGPMASSLVKQFLNQIEWPELDILLIDNPPGTGDIQITLAQNSVHDGVLLVSTPDEIALLDVRRAYHMYQTLKIPVLGLVENMSYFICDGCDKKHYLFSKEGGLHLKKELNLAFCAQIPRMPEYTELSDVGKSYFKDGTSDHLKKPFRDLAQKLLFDLKTSPVTEGLSGFKLKWDPASNATL